VLRDTRDNFAR